MALSRARNRWGLFYERLMGIRPGNPVSDDAIKNAVEVVDEHTVRFKLVEPYAPFLIDLAYPSTAIIQKDHAIENGAWSWDLDKTVDYSSIDGVDSPMQEGDALMCSGPYIPGEWSKGERLVFTRNENYWKGIPEVEFVRFITVPEWSTRNLMLQVGDVDGIAVATPEEFEQMKEVKGVQTIWVKYAGFVEVMYFGLDRDPAVMPPEHQVPVDFFNDPHMRKAFAYAFPYDKYIEEIWLGYAEAAKGVLPPGFLGAYDNYPYTYDLEKAEEELKLAWDGKYYEEGFQIAAGTQLWAFGTHGRAYEMLAEEFAKIDPKYKIIPVGTPWSDMLRMPLGMLVGVIGLDPVWYRNIYHSEYGFEYSYGWQNDRVDELIVQSTETPFIDERLPLLEEAMDIVADECPGILTVYTPHFVVFKDYVNGYWYQINHIDEFGYWFDMSKG
jgi:peptide/nickel transport system substrate-binding protein